MHECNGFIAKFSTHSIVYLVLQFIIGEKIFQHILIKMLLHSK